MNMRVQQPNYNWGQPWSQTMDQIAAPELFNGNWFNNTLQGGSGNLPGMGNDNMNGGVFGNFQIPGSTGGPPVNYGNAANGWFQKNQNLVQGVGQGLGAFSSLASLYGMFKQLGLQKDAFKFSREGTKRNFNAQAQGFNNAVDDQYSNRSATAALRGEEFASSGIFDKRKVAAWN